jgi:hypothetical protein
LVRAILERCFAHAEMPAAVEKTREGASLNRRMLLSDPISSQPPDWAATEAPLRDQPSLLSRFPAAGLMLAVPTLLGSPPAETLLFPTELRAWHFPCWQGPLALREVRLALALSCPARLQSLRLHVPPGTADFNIRLQTGDDLTSLVAAAHTESLLAPDCYLLTLTDTPSCRVVVLGVRGFRCLPFAACRHAFCSCPATVQFSFGGYRHLACRSLCLPHVVPPRQLPRLSCIRCQSSLRCAVFSRGG